MAECVALAKDVGAAIAERFQVPVFLYEEASTNPARKNLEDIRRGEFEGLAAKMASAGWAPDFGPATPHAAAGASVVGARMPLIAYNINLNTDRLEVAKKIAAAIRHSSGGLRYVKAMGVKLDDRNLAQVSMNLTNYEKTPIFRVFEMVKREAERYGVTILESEVVGLVPSAALVRSAEFYLQLERFGDEQILEKKLRDGGLRGDGRSRSSPRSTATEVHEDSANTGDGFLILLRASPVVLRVFVSNRCPSEAPATALPAHRSWFSPFVLRSSSLLRGKPVISVRSPGPPRPTPAPLPHRRAAPARCRRTSSCDRGCCARRRGRRPCARCCPAGRRAP